MLSGGLADLALAERPVPVIDRACPKSAHGLLVPTARVGESTHPWEYQMAPRVAGSGILCTRG